MFNKAESIVHANLEGDSSKQWIDSILRLRSSIISENVLGSLLNFPFSSQLLLPDDRRLFRPERKPLVLFNVVSFGGDWVTFLVVVSEDIYTKFWKRWACRWLRLRCTIVKDALQVYRPKNISVLKTKGRSMHHLDIVFEMIKFLC